MTTNRIPRIDKLKRDSDITIDYLLRQAAAQKEKDLKKAKSSYLNKYLGAKAASVFYGFNENEIKGISTSKPSTAPKTELKKPSFEIDLEIDNSTAHTQDIISETLETSSQTKKMLARVGPSEVMPTESFLHKRANELSGVDSSWRAIFLGKDYARTYAGFTQSEISAIETQRKLDREAYLNLEQKKIAPAPVNRTKESKTQQEEANRKYIEYLRNRAVILARVDASWTASCLCLGQDYARAKAGFTEDEVTAIEKQATIDRENKLKDPIYLRKRSKELEQVDSSWTAYFFGQPYARNSAGFKYLETRAIEKQLAADKKAQEGNGPLAFITRIPQNLFGDDKEKYRKTASNLIRDRNAARLINYKSRKIGLG